MNNVAMQAIQSENQGQAILLLGSLLIPNINHVLLLNYMPKYAYFKMFYMCCKIL